MAGRINFDPVIFRADLILVISTRDYVKHVRFEEAEPPNDSVYIQRLSELLGPVDGERSLEWEGKVDCAQQPAGAKLP